jgi:microcystin-dependent protein
VSDTPGGLFKGRPFTEELHRDPDKHYIGETLPVGSVTDMAASSGVANATGDSIYAARIDHTHLSDASISYQPGDIKTGLWTDPGPGWLLLDGSTVVGAQTLYPALWAVPGVASWKSGANLVLPDMNSRFLIGKYGTLGVIGGANSVTLTTAELPAHTHTLSAHTHEHPHTHTIAHTHTFADTSGGVSANHTHAHAHTHADTFVASSTTSHAIRRSSTAGTTDSSMGASTTGTSVAISTNPIITTTISGAVGAASVANTGNNSVTHTHAISGTTSAASNANSGAASDATTGGPSVANTGSAGTGAAFSIVSAHLEVNFAIKT